MKGMCNSENKRATHPEAVPTGHCWLTEAIPKLREMLIAEHLRVRHSAPAQSVIYILTITLFYTCADGAGGVLLCAYTRGIFVHFAYT